MKLGMSPHDFFENLEGEGGEERPPSEKDHRHDGEDQVTPAPMEKWQNCEMAKTQWLKSHDGQNYYSITQGESTESLSTYFMIYQLTYTCILTSGQ